MTDLATTERPPDELTTEYVVGSAGLFFRGGRLRALSHAFDDLTADFGDDLYERMLLDPQVVACTNVLRALLQDAGAQLPNPLADEDADGYDLAGEILTFCESVLDDLSTPLDEVLWDMLLAIATGSRIAELVYEQRQVRNWFVLDQSTTVSQDQVLLIPRAIKVKPRRSVAFVTDPYMNVQGILALRTGDVGIGTTALTTSDRERLLPREKFMALSFRPKDGDPRGSSAARPAHSPWWTKQQVWEEFLKYLAQFASPSLVGTTSEASEKSGVVKTNADGTKTTVAAVTALMEQLLAFQNGTAIAVPYGTVIDALKATGDGEAFHKAFALCDRQIAEAILHQTLATQEAQHQARASSEVHQDTLETIIRQAKRAVCLALRRDVLRPMVRYNYGEREAALLTPHVSLGSVEQQDLAKMMNAIAQLARAGYLDPSQLPGIDALLNIPVRVAPVEGEGEGQPPPRPAPPNAGDEEDEEEGEEGDEQELDETDDEEADRER